MESAIGSIWQLLPVAAVVADYAEPNWFYMLECVGKFKVLLVNSPECMNGKEHTAHYVTFSTLRNPSRIVCRYLPEIPSETIIFDNSDNIVDDEHWFEVIFYNILRPSCECKRQTAFRQFQTQLALEWNKTFRKTMPKEESIIATILNFFHSLLFKK